ncbi:GreA/GreB family elongation factor [Pseudoclavibacter sp. VKM Ac-2867]|nr:GreA/GreB family elongation factor [Pseudoclavibacter sp. VKM Ac-2867]
MKEEVPVETVWMTPTALRALQDELEALLRVGADSSARGRELRKLIDHAEVAAKPDDGLVEAGMQVTVRFDGAGREATFLLGSRVLAGLDPSVAIDVYSSDSPLGEAILGSRVGSTVTFTAPAGQQCVTILSAVPFSW